MSYHKKFRNIHPQVVRATRDLAKARPWELNQFDQWTLAQFWVNEVSGIYGIEPPIVRWYDGAEEWGGGGYTGYNHTIYLSKFSLVTLLHEFRHHMQWTLPLNDPSSVGHLIHIAVDNDASEEDARGWSCSLFYKACPRRFNRMAEAGRLLYT